MWIYKQTEGELYLDGALIATGYAGLGEGRNNPDKQELRGVGPLPRGRYTINPPRTSTRLGPYVLDLWPDPRNMMYDRSLFRIHGDSATGNASDGCIVLKRVIRQRIWESGDHVLEVIR